MFKKLEKRLNLLSRYMEDIKKIQIKLLQMKTKKSEIKNTLDTAEKRLVNLKTLKYKLFKTKH